MGTMVVKRINFFNKKISLIALFFCAASLVSCSTKDETNLSSNDINFIESLGILQKDETIIMFESNSGYKGIEQSGNFITDDRIASYWIDSDMKEINSAFYYNEIDSITLTDLVSKPTYASYLTVYKSDSSSFKVYVDADSTRTYRFFKKAKDDLMKNRIIR